MCQTPSKTQTDRDTSVCPLCLSRASSYGWTKRDASQKFKGG